VALIRTLMEAEEEMFNLIDDDFIIYEDDYDPHHQYGPTTTQPPLTTDPTTGLTPASDPTTQPPSTTEPQTTHDSSRTRTRGDFSTLYCNLYYINT